MNSSSRKYGMSLGVALLVSEPKLMSLLKMLVLIQGQLDERVSYPRIVDFTAPKLSDPGMLEPGT